MSNETTPPRDYYTGPERRHRRDDTYAAELASIRREIQSARDRMDAVDSQLSELKSMNADIREHMRVTCEVAQSMRILLRPIIWVASSIRAITIWVGGTAVAVLSIWALGEKANWW